jgi:endonuclease YncB( thermonuclease family)
MLGGADNPNGELPSYITGADTTDVNAVQIRKGLAWVYRYHGKPARTDYAQLEAEARRQGAGLWSVPGQTEPWRWRSQHQDRGFVR